MTDTRQAGQKPAVVDHPEIFETFADSLASSFSDGLTLRLDFAVTRLEAVGSQPIPKRHINCRLVLSAGAADELFRAMQQINAALIEKAQAKSG